MFVDELTGSGHKNDPENYRKNLQAGVLLAGTIN